MAWKNLQFMANGLKVRGENLGEKPLRGRIIQTAYCTVAQDNSHSI
jgi:hypothetical protein